MNSWKPIAVAGLLGVLLGQSSAFVQTASAAPPDVIGSPNVPVQSYRNRAGNFVLWSDGHISQVATPGQTPATLASNAPNAYTDTAGPGKPKPTAGRSTGSPNVPVGVVQDSKGSYVLFANGLVRTPNNPLAAAPGIISHAVRWASCDPSGNIIASSGDLTVTRTNKGNYDVQFTPVYKSSPSVVATGVHYLLTTESISTGVCHVTGKKLFNAVEYDEDTAFSIWITGDDV